MKNARAGRGECAIVICKLCGVLVEVASHRIAQNCICFRCSACHPGSLYEFS